MTLNVPLALLDWIFCWHRRTTFPITIKRVTSVACLDCGRRFHYDLARMRRGKPLLK